MLNRMGIGMGVVKRGRGSLVFDDFNRPDTMSGLGAAKTGQMWESTTGSTYGIQSNRSYLAAYLPDKPEPVALVDAASSDCVVSIEFYGGPNYSGTHPAAGLAIRASDDMNHIRFYPDVNHFRLARKEAGSMTVLGVNNNIVPANGQILKMILSGTSIKCYVDQVLAFDIISTFNTKATKHGFYSRTMHTPTRWDNFRVEAIT